MTTAHVDFRRSRGSGNPSWQPCVYLLASQPGGTLYVGATSNLVKRVWEHKNDFVGGFAKRNGVHSLVWYELHSTMESGITREKAIKRCYRAWKIGMVQQSNPAWSDLYGELA
jgi:putative endonuclease